MINLTEVNRDMMAKAQILLQLASPEGGSLSIRNLSAAQNLVAQIHGAKDTYGARIAGEGGKKVLPEHLKRQARRLLRLARAERGEIKVADLGSAREIVSLIQNGNWGKDEAV